MKGVWPKVDSVKHVPVEIGQGAMDDQVGAVQRDLQNLPRELPRELNAAIEWAYHRLTAGVRKPALVVEIEIKAALRQALGRSKSLRSQARGLDRRNQTKIPRSLRRGGPTQ